MHHARPSIDVLFESAADAYRERVIGERRAPTRTERMDSRRSGGSAASRSCRTRTRPSDARCVAALAATNADAVLQLPQIGLFLYGLVCRPGPDEKAEA